MPSQNFAAQMAGGFDEKAGGAQMGVMQGPMVSKHSVQLDGRAVGYLLILDGFIVAATLWLGRHTSV